MCKGRQYLNIVFFAVSLEYDGRAALGTQMLDKLLSSEGKSLEEAHSLHISLDKLPQHIPFPSGR